MTREELYLMGYNGKIFYEQESSLRIGARRFEEIFQSVAEQPNGNMIERIDDIEY